MLAATNEWMDLCWFAIKKVGQVGHYHLPPFSDIHTHLNLYCAQSRQWWCYVMLRTVTVLYSTVCAGNFLENSSCSGDTARMSGPAAGGGETADGGTGHTQLQVPQNKYRSVQNSRWPRNQSVYIWRCSSSCHGHHGWLQGIYCCTITILKV